MLVRNLCICVMISLVGTVHAVSQEMIAMHPDFVDVAEVVPGIVVEARYAGYDNFVGQPVAGYEAGKVVVSKAVAEALANIQRELRGQGLSLKIYDGYRPQRAVDHFMRWIADENDQKNKAQFYPDISKSELVPKGYIAEKSGHSRGGSIDVTLVRVKADGWKRDMDMGSNWDLFDERSHADTTNISTEAQENRARLADIMIKYGFAPYSEEWWHFTLAPEPFPDTYFDFPIR